MEIPEQGILTYGMIRDQLDRLNRGQEKIEKILERLAGLEEQRRGQTKELERLDREFVAFESKFDDTTASLYRRLEENRLNLSGRCDDLDKSLGMLGGRFSSHSGVVKWVLDSAMVIGIAIVGGLCSAIFQAWIR